MKECKNCQSVLLNKRNIFCSVICANSFSAKNRIKKEYPACKTCKNIITTGQVLFCSRSCSAIFNNKKRVKKKLPLCKKCGNPTNSHEAIYCGLECFYVIRRGELDLERWRNGEEVGFSTYRLRRILREEDGCQCSQCKNTHWNGLPIALEVEHKDGNSSNNVRSNVCLLCPNCHAQTPTYKAKNVGNGRAFRRERYKAGKSY